MTGDASMKNMLRENLRSGRNARRSAMTLVEILIGEIADAVVLPRGQYLSSGNRRYLYRIDGGIATRIGVEYGEITDEYVQVVSGVQAGDRIITSSYQNYIDYQTIELGEDR